MKPEFREHVTRILAAYYDIPAAKTAQTGTVLRSIGPDEWDGWLELTPVGASVAAVRAAYPADHTLTGADFVAVWGADAARIGHMLVDMLDRTVFKRFVPDPRYNVRALAAADEAAFAVFQARCSEVDLNESDISIDHEVAYGVFDGSRIVAGARTYMWDGLVDVGVLTDPDYRGQGLGKAVVSAVCAFYVDNAAETRFVCYRHGANHAASRGIAQSLGFSFYANFECVYRAP